MKHLPLVLALAGAVAAVSLRRTRWARPSLLASRLAFAALVVQAPLYFLTKGGFRLSSPVCEWTFGPALAMHSLTNVPHIVLFTVFFVLTYVQLPGVQGRALWSAAATMAMGLLVELAQGVSGHGHCRMRDLIPDSAGALLGFAIVWFATTLARAPRDAAPLDNEAGAPDTRAGG